MVPVFDDDSLRRLTMPSSPSSARGTRCSTAPRPRAGWRRPCRTPTVRLLPDAGHLLPDQAGVVLDFLDPASEVAA
jgi:hypothetical protein